MKKQWAISYKDKKGSAVIFPTLYDTFEECLQTDREDA